MKKNLLNLLLAIGFAALLIVNVGVVSTQNNTKLTISSVNKVFAQDGTSDGSDGGGDTGGGGDSSSDNTTGMEDSGSGRRVASATFTCSGTGTKKIVTYKNANGQITGTVEFFRGNVTGSAGAGWTSSTTETSTVSWSASLQGNSCPSGTGTCSPVNPC